MEELSPNKWLFRIAWWILGTIAGLILLGMGINLWKERRKK